MIYDSVPAATLDYEQIGVALVNLALAAALAGHARPVYSARDYLRRDRLTPDGQFVRDVLTQRSENIADHWFGGELNAIAIAGSALAARFAGTAEEVREDGHHAA